MLGLPWQQGVNTKKASNIGGNKEEHNNNGELREKVSFSPRSRILLSPQVAPRHIGHMHFVNHEARLLEVGWSITAVYNFLSFLFTLSYV